MIRNFNKLETFVALKITRDRVWNITSRLPIYRYFHQGNHELYVHMGICHIIYIFQCLCDKNALLVPGKLIVQRKIQ